MTKCFPVQHTREGLAPINRNERGNHSVIVYDSLTNSIGALARKTFASSSDFDIPPVFGHVGDLWKLYESVELRDSNGRLISLMSPQERVSFVKSPVYIITVCKPSDRENVTGGSWLDRYASYDLMHVVVAPEYRNRGIGGDCVDTVERYGRHEIRCGWNTSDPIRHAINNQLFKSRGYDISIQGMQALARKKL